MTSIETWDNFVVEVTPFPRKPFTEEQFDVLGDAIVTLTEGLNLDPIVSSCNGVIELGYSATDDMTEDEWRKITTTAILQAELEGTGRMHHEVNFMKART